MEEGIKAGLGTLREIILDSFAEDSQARFRTTPADLFEGIVMK